MTTATARKPRKPKVPKPLESEVQGPGIKLMNSMGWTMFRRNVGKFKTKGGGFFRAAEPGQSDTYGWIPSQGCRHAEVEFKRPGERPTRLQVGWLLKCHQAGAVAFWADDTATLTSVISHINRGGEIRYLDTTRIYSEKVKGVRGMVKVEGPSGDYELI